MTAFLRALLVLLAVLAALAGVLVYSVASRGLSTRTAPGRVETMLARGMRSLATPHEVRSRRNPVEPTRATMAEALTHFADHCAQCHANDGSGQTDLGRSLYPPAPDMRLAATQELSDGEIFAIIENGIRLTGMPAWGTGTADGERASWGLVHFVRRLPSLTEEDISRMEALNPRTAEAWRQDEAARRFLAGEDGMASPAPAHVH